MSLEKVERFIVENGLLQGGEKVIAGVSGGADSVALLDILHAFKIECVVAHCNFHLRGEESNRDAFFVEELCQKYNLKFERIDFDTEVHARLNSISIEMAARELRYNWFEELRKIHLADKIAIAHHQDDSVETILLNLTRGTGIKGLTGIAPMNGYIIRPLLCMKRNDILKYLQERKLTYVDDSTNSEDLYTRNKIRLNILPMLESINPSAKDAILRTAENLKQVSNIYRMYIDQVTKEIFKEEKINISLLVQYMEPEALLFEILSPYGFNPATIRRIFLSIISQSGKIFHSDTHELLKDRGFLILKKKEGMGIESFNIHEDDSELTYPIPLEIERILLEGRFTIEKNPAILYSDAGKVSYPLVLRRWKKGDWFVPFGMKGKKKISDYFTDHKFSLFDKESAWLLCSGDDIVWLVGHRSDDRFRIDSDTKEVLKISILNKDMKM
ncbi:MAG: tRNA lysidine(34) synthetase TilS [Prevotella sp.]|jgi:tRNA(Ile)-lysidine synthase|nr:tRNA lysidine(34) synthetase TilS [Prevotella sp.]